MERPIYYVPRISTKHGEDVDSIYSDKDDAVAAVAEFCRAWWTDAEEEAKFHAEELLVNGELPLPATNEATIELYYQLLEDESYEIHEAVFYA